MDVTIRQLIIRLCHESVWMEKVIQMDFPPTSGMTISFSRTASIEAETIVYDVEEKRYIVYPAQWTVSRDETTEEVVEYFKKDGFVVTGR